MVELFEVCSHIAQLSRYDQFFSLLERPLADSQDLWLKVDTLDLIRRLLEVSDQIARSAHVSDHCLNVCDGRMAATNLQLFDHRFLCLVDTELLQ